MSYLVLEVKPYDFNGQTGRVEGVRVSYLDLASPSENGSRGFATLMVNAAPGVDAAFSAVPGIYDLDFRQRAGARGRPQLVLNGARLVRPVDLPEVVGCM